MPDDPKDTKSSQPAPRPKPITPATSERGDGGEVEKRPIPRPNTRSSS